MTFRHSRFAFGRTQLRGLHGALAAAVLPPKDQDAKEGCCERPLVSSQCTGFGMRHGAAVDKGVADWIASGAGRVPHNADPCVVTVKEALRRARITPISAQFRCCDPRARVGTAVDILAVYQGRPLLLELKTTHFKSRFFAPRGVMRGIDIPHSAATAALLQSEIPAVWVSSVWGLPKPKTAVLVVCPRGYAKLLRPSATVRAAAERVVGLIRDASA